MHKSSPSNLKHTNFFTSLKRLDKRLKLEANPSDNSAVPPPLPPGNEENIADTLGTPLYLDCSSSINRNVDVSDLQEFQSISPDFTPTHRNLSEEKPDRAQDSSDEAVEIFSSGNKIEMLMKSLKLTDSQEIEWNCSGCDDEFQRKIVGCKGPENATEVKRLEGWIKHLLKNKKEPFTLALLLLGKASLLQSNNGFDELEFPSAIHEFLNTDPPSQSVN